MSTIYAIGESDTECIYSYVGTVSSATGGE